MLGKKDLQIKKGKIERKKNYKWEGRNKKGKKVSGITPALSSQNLKMILLEQNVSPTKIKQESSGLFSERKQKINSGDIALLTRQISTIAHFSCCSDRHSNRSR